MPVPLSVGLGEAVTSVGHTEGTIPLGGELDPIGRAVVDRWGRSSRWGDGERGRLVIDGIGDEHSGHGVLLSAQQRKVKLPEILETGGRMHGLHDFRLTTLPRTVI